MSVAPDTNSSKHAIAYTLGVVSIVLGLFFSGYAAILFGSLGVGFGIRARRIAPTIISGLGVLIGLSAQVMRFILDRAA